MPIQGKDERGRYTHGNQYSVGNNGGQPRKYANVDELATAIDSYFEFIKGESHWEEVEIQTKKGEPKFEDKEIWDRYPEKATITGLALYLGFADKQSLYDQEKNTEYSYLIKRARTLIEKRHEENMFSDKPQGSIFVLKNMGWKDKSEVEMKQSESLDDYTPEELLFMAEMKEKREAK
jgi:hypothetical protein